MSPVNAITALWSALAPLANEIPDPNDVKPGWIGFTVFLFLAAAVVVLSFSFRKQLRKVDFEEQGEDRPADASDRGPTSGSAGGSETDEGGAAPDGPRDT
jgi:hypothetical protein